MKFLDRSAAVMLFAGAILFLNTGCAVNAMPGNTLSNEQQESLDIAAEKKCIELLEAYKNNDYQRLQKNLPPALARQFTEESFTKSRNALANTLGKLKSYEFVTRLKAPVFRNMIYKVTFERIGSDRKAIEQETLFRIMLAEERGRIQVISFVFF